jgi:hypothetical protein
MAICKSCGKKYSRWTTPVSAKGICTECFELELQTAPNAARAEPPSFVRDSSSETTSELLKKRRPRSRISLRSFIPRTRSKAVFVIVMTCYGYTLASLIGAWARAAHIKNPPPAFYWFTHGDPAANLLSLVVFAPIIESLILIGAIEVIRIARAPETVQVIVAALFIAELHYWPWWPHAVIVAPGFCIQAASYLYWRRSSWKVAYWVVVTIHALNNFIPALTYIGYATRHS